MIIISVICAISVLTGMMRTPADTELTTSVQPSVTRIPHLGQVEVLNGCGISGAAGIMAGFLRDRSFDVKNSRNADSWNYPKTLVIARSSDTKIAEQIARALGTDGFVILKNNQDLYDVTVIVGNDLSARIPE